MQTMPRPQSHAPNSSYLSTQPVPESSSKSPHHTLCENLPKRQQEELSPIQTNSSGNIPAPSASGIPPTTDSSSRYLVDARLKIAQQVLNQIRGRIPGKSTNKTYGTNPPDRKSKLYSHQALTDRFNAWQAKQKSSSISKIELANCGDLSFLAALTLSRS